MRILAIDPGAKRAGWAVLSEGSYIASGILGLPDGDNYQKRRLDLIDFWVGTTKYLLAEYEPLLVVSEIVPPTGGSIPSIINRQLGLTVITTVQAIARDWGTGVSQVSATTVKKKIAGKGKASKVMVRDGVLKALPELEPRRPEWTGKDAVFDEVDALAIGLTYLT